MPIKRREMTAAPIMVGSRRYTPVAGDIVADLRLSRGTFRAGYARPLRMEVADGKDRQSISIPDRQLQIMLALAVVATTARMIERRRNK